MNETSLCHNLRVEKGHFDLYLKGKGIDIGCGSDKLVTMADYVDGWDISNGDAMLLETIPDETYDFVYSSHCLQLLTDVEKSLCNWSRILKPGGFLYFTVPDFFLYEKNTWPSAFNNDHKQSFSLSTDRTVAKRWNHFHISDIKVILENFDMELVTFKLEDDGFNYDIEKEIDQTIFNNYLAQILFIFKKKNRQKKIGLCMIVKNEERIIERCLNSVKPLIDYVSIVDTGSTDNTVGIICNWMKANNILGTIYQEPWKNFAYNRTFALAKIKEKENIDYVLTIDADEVLEIEPNLDLQEIKKNLTCDLYSITCKFMGTEYSRHSITTNKKVFAYKGVIHEFLDCAPISSMDNLKGIYNIHLQDSARNHIVDKYRKDAEALEEGLKTETDQNMIARYTFYLAQSYKDCGEHNKALYWYEKRSRMSVWNQEEYVSLYMVALLKEGKNYPEDDIIQSYLRAHEILPYRIEVLHEAARYCRIHNRFEQAYFISKYAKSFPINKNGLFVSIWMWDYGIDEQYLLACYCTGRYTEGLEFCKNLLKTVSDHQKSRIEAHINSFEQKIL